MTRRQRAAVLGLLGTLCVPTSVSAQWVVFDPTNYVQAIATVEQLVRQYALLLEQTRRLPLDLARRYRVPTLPWLSHVLVAADYAAPVLDALNRGAVVGDPYGDTVTPLEAVRAVLARVPVTLRDRLGTGYATIELADRLARTAIQQTGVVRASGATVQRTIQALEDDAVSNDDRFHTQAALLNKINGAAVLSLRIGEQSSQFLSTVVEQLVVVNKRQRDAEAKAMNAQLYQWQYGQSYGADLFRETARDLDAWRQP